MGPFLADRNSAAGRAFVADLRAACHEIGFAYLVGHGIDPALEAALLDATGQFFALPEAERRRLAIGNSPHFRGYTLLGGERTAGGQDWRDQIDIGPEEPAISPISPERPWERLRGPNQWPAQVPALRAALLPWMAAMQDLGMQTLQALGLGLGQAADCFDAAMTPNPYTRVKVMRYPAQERQRDTGQGLGLHHDSGLLTFILQHEVGGLQVKVGEDLVDAPPMPGAYILNLGEMMQVASGGYLRATPHRVESPAEGAQRLAVGFFFNPRLDAAFAPLTLPPDLAARASGADNADPADPVHAVFGINTLRTRMRAHPDVTERFYKDVDIAGARPESAQGI